MIPIVNILYVLAGWSGFLDLPRWSFVAIGIAAFLIAGVLTTALTPLNRGLLVWRKERGRDIEEEERYETESGMIRLTPNDEDL